MVNLERLSENRVKLVVTVSAEQFDAALDAAFEKVVKDVKVDGFRPGKLPKSIYISRFGWESLYNEAIEIAFQQTYGYAIQEAGVYPTDDPKVELVDPAQIKKGSSFDYTCEVDVWPNVHLGEYKGVKVKKQSTRVLKKEVEAYIENALKVNADYKLKNTKFNTKSFENAKEIVFIQYVANVENELVFATKEENGKYYISNTFELFIEKKL